jgi:hypothetical protein
LGNQESSIFHFPAPCFPSWEIYWRGHCLPFPQAFPAGAGLDVHPGSLRAR